MRQLAAALAVVLGSTTAFALPPNSPYREGANHHVGDDSFVAQFGRRPTPRDSEPSRMHAHFAYVRAWLANRPATKPELAAQRAKMLAAFDAYIAKGTTPDNAHVPWRTPVFIDDHGTICAVGFLIQETAGRPLAEKIAEHHRYDLLEDIASDMPEVRDWVAASGLTLEELASIQPAYSEPEVNTWRTWDLAKHPKPDGAYERNGVRGAFHHGKMEGDWTVTSDGKVVGRGDLKHGAGAWTSFYPTGEKLAEGRYRNNRAVGPWKLFHASGNLAAEGSFDAGNRAGRWQFYYDTAAKTPIAIGSFTRGGWVTGTWRHFDATGALIATSRTVTPDQWGDTNIMIDGGEGSLLDITASPAGIHHEIHQGTVGGSTLRLDMYARGGEHLYVQNAFGHESMFDGDGHLLVRGDGTWTSSDCGWSHVRKQIARDGDVARLHGVLYKDAAQRAHATGKDIIGGGDVGEDTGPTCRNPHAITGPRATELDALIADRDHVRAIPPSFVRARVLGEDTANDSLTDDAKARVADMTQILAANMSMYLEWPHIDGAFTQLFGTLAGRFTWRWTDGDPERDPDPDAQ